MEKSNELITIFQRILDGSADKKDADVLRQHLQAYDSPGQLQLAKSITNAAEVKELHVGLS
jgi:Effector-associated domain 10